MRTRQKRLQRRFRKDEHGGLREHFGVQMVRDQDPVPSNFRSPTLIPKLSHFPSRRRCKWRLLCEWVCTVTSVSVRSEKGINAKSEILKRKRKVEGRGRGRERKRKRKKEEGKG